MPGMKREPEKQYYERVREFLKSEMRCVVESFDRHGRPRPFICRGLDRLIVDVYGLRGFKERSTRGIEGIAVEVKGSRKRTPLRHLNQASQYLKLAHRSYLAQPREFDPRTVSDASRLGVGLLRITENGVNLVAEARPFIPEPEKFELFVHKSLRIVKCGLCDCYRKRYGPKVNGHKSERLMQGHEVRDDLSPIAKNKTFNKKVYICEKCEALVREFAKTSLLQKSIHKLEKQVKQLKRKLAKR